MWDGDIGCVPVVAESGHVVGMVTDRDICMAALTREQPLREIPVAVAMSKEILSCPPDATLIEAEEIMRSGQLRRLPVIDSDSSLVGIVSLNDFCASGRARDRTKESRPEGARGGGDAGSSLRATSGPGREIPTAWDEARVENAGLPVSTRRIACAIRGSGPPPPRPSPAESLAERPAPTRSRDIGGASL
jgi:hypothetical protein